MFERSAADGPRRVDSTAIRGVLLFALVSVLAACGPNPPQAPLRYAKKLDSATGGMSLACGLAYQVTAFPGDHRADLATLNATASSKARKLAEVYRRNPKWVYQGETIAQIVGASEDMLGACDLRAARRTLLRLTAPP
jgi:hypothetical protein